MALALLDFKEFDRQQAVFNIDTGTNSFYKFRIGDEKGDAGGVETITNIRTGTHLKQRRSNNASFLNTNEEVRLPKNLFNRTTRYLQLISCKDESGRSPAVSKVISVPVEFQNVKPEFLDIHSSLSLSVMPQQEFNTNRRLTQSQPFLTQEMSLDDILSSLVRLVLPAAVGMLGGPPSGSNNNNTTTSSSTNVNAINSLLSMLLQAVTGQSPAISRQQSLANYDYGLNRFTHPDNSQFSKQFIFGIDDALLATLAGPIIQQGIQLLPQLINAANQHKLDTLKANNQLMTSLNSDVQRRLMLQQLLQNVPSSPASGGSAMDSAQLMQLLQQLQAAAPAVATPPSALPAPAPSAPTAAAHSLSLTGNFISYSLSNSVLLSLENKTQQKWNRTDKVVYQKGKPLQFDIKVTVNPEPKAPLPKAIFRLVIKDTATQKVFFEKTYKQKNVAANAVISFTAGADELAQVPVQKSLSLFTEMRWLSSASSKEYKAVGSEDIVFVSTYFIKDWGKTVSDEKELSDINVYRSFWNKVWESGVLNKGDSKKLWEINSNLRYHVFLSPEHNANGLIETKIQQTQDDADSLTVKTFGKMKSGIELSVAEMNKLASLWQGETPLDAEKLQAVSNTEFAKNNAAEMIYNVKLKGREGERGLVWIVPTFKLVEITLNKVNKTNNSGQVTDCGEEKAKFPIPVSVRVLGLKSKK